ncbi:MAG: HD-GYP domain-containing protein [Bacillota bacterium]
MAVADAYDAMTHRSQYREPMDREAAVAEIRRNAGTQFDPEVVRAFLKAFARPAS